MAVRNKIADTSTLLLRTGPRWPRHRPGQYVGVGARLEGVWHWRTYSVTSRPGDRLLAVTVTAVPGGIVSNALALRHARGHRAAPRTTGGRVRAARAGTGEATVRHGRQRRDPRDGDAAPPGRDPAGDARRVWVAVHCDRTADDVVFGAELQALAGANGMRLVERHTALDGRLTPDVLTGLVPDWGLPGRRGRAARPACSTT